MTSLDDLGHHLPCLAWDSWAPFQYTPGSQKSKLTAFPGTLCTMTPLQVTDNTSCLNYSQLGKVFPGSVCVYLGSMHLSFLGEGRSWPFPPFPGTGLETCLRPRVSLRKILVRNLVLCLVNIFGRFFFSLPALPFCPPP